jgi:hypothetical protein
MLAYRLVDRPVASRLVRRSMMLGRGVASFKVKFRRGIDGPQYQTNLSPSRLYWNSTLLFRRFQIAVISPLVQASRSLNFWILPDPVSGNVSTTNQCFGVLCGASEARM